MGKTKKFTLTTTKGCIRILGILCGIILVCSLMAALISSDFGKIKISHVVLDSRGGTFEADLYVPAHTSCKDCLPAILVAHGRGSNKGQYRGISEELARRGYVVLNTSAYGSGLSEMPPYDDGGQGVDGYTYDDAPQGLLDALNYVRTLTYVDKTRVGIIGHSGGSRRAGLVAVLDCGYYSLNDILLNTLHTTFGVAIKESDLYKDADEIAEQTLTGEQLEYYKYLKEEKRQNYDTRVKSVCLVGSNASKIETPVTENVAGHQVSRSCQTNFGVINGSLDFSYRTYNRSDPAKAGWYTGSSDIVPESWYQLDDEAGSSSIVGEFGKSSITENGALSEAISKRASRVCMIEPKETHSKNHFSKQTTADIIRYFAQTLNYNRGNLTDASSKALDPGNIIFMWRAILNCLAMLAMLSFVFPITGIFLQSKALSYDPQGIKIGNKTLGITSYWLFSLLAVAAGYYGIYRANKGIYHPFVKRYLPDIFRLVSTSRNTLGYIFIISAVSLIMLACFFIMGKKRDGDSGFSALHLDLKFSDVIKYFGLAVGITVACYTSLLVIEYLFNEDYRLWMSAFTDMKVEYWGIAFGYMVLFIPCFLINGSAVNYMVRDDIPQWKDTLYAVIINSAGVWLCCLTQIIVMMTTGKNFSPFTGSYQMVLIAPITVYIARKCYNMTKSVWLGTFVNSMLVAWSLVSSIGINDSYWSIGFFSRLFNI